MNRREALRILSCGSLALSLGTAKSVASAPAGALPPVPADNALLYRFRIGDCPAYSLLCGGMDVTAAQPFFAPEAKPEEFATALHETTVGGRLRMPYNVLLVQWHGRHVLIDSGPPGEAGKQAPIADLLAALGVAPEEIAAVVLTHAHFDHLGGLLDGDRPRFARAVHYVAREEQAFWLSPRPDFSKMQLNADAVLSVAQSVFQKIPFVPVTSGAELLPGLTAVLATGHTPGHLMLRFQCQDQSLTHIGDLCHHARFLLEHPRWSVGSDIDPALAVQTRLAVFTRLAATQERVFGFHLSYPGLGRIAAAGESFRWIPEDWSAQG